MALKLPILANDKPNEIVISGGEPLLEQNINKVIDKNFYNLEYITKCKLKYICGVGCALNIIGS